MGATPGSQQTRHLISGHRPGRGRPRGALNRKTIEVREFSAKVIDDPDYQRNVIKRIKAGQANHIETLLWHYRYGKPPERIQGEGFGPLLEIVLRRPLEEDPLADRTPLRVKEPNEHPGIVAVPESPSG